MLWLEAKISKRFQPKRVQGNAFLSRFSLKMETDIKIESHTKFVHCLFSLKMYIFIAFVLKYFIRMKSAWKNSACLLGSKQIPWKSLFQSSLSRMGLCSKNSWFVYNVLCAGKGYDLDKSQKNKHFVTVVLKLNHDFKSFYWVRVNKLGGTCYHLCYDKRETAKGPCKTPN